MAAISGIARLDKGWVGERWEGVGQMERELKRRGRREVDQYMDSYGDNITIGCLGKIVYYVLLIFFFLVEMR